MQGISELLGIPAVSRTLDMMSYGHPLTTGAGGLGGTTRLKPDVLEAIMTVAPLGKPATMATLQAARLARQAAMAGGRAGERYAERVIPQIMERGGLGAEMLQGMSNRTISPLDVYHGSPHRLPPTARNPLGEFDASKIGTGEGAQVYGHGIYTAEARPVAEEYAKNLSEKKYLLSDEQKQMQSLAFDLRTAVNEKNSLRPLASFSQDAAKRIKEIEQQEQLLRGTIEGLEKITSEQMAGNLYKVDLPDEKIAKMLDWDKPLSQQSPEVQAALKGIEAKFPEIPDFNLRKWMDTDPLASTFHNVLNRDLGVDPAIIASTLKERGIPGVKYLDQQSRNAGGWHLTSPDNTVKGKWMLKSSDYNSNGVFFDSKKEAEAALKEKLGKETRNFVTFPGEEKNLTILERNGQKATRTNNLAPQQTALPVENSNMLSYRGQHTAPGPDFGAPLHDLTGGGQMYPADVYSSKAAQYYGTGYPKADKEAFALAQRVRGNPDAEITMYRAVPKDDNINAINPGDWVTLSKDYAKTHGESALKDNYKILSKKVKAKDVWTNADSIHEFGYQPTP
jgi:hypothetical protein